jgi:hypothetical protein
MADLKEKHEWHYTEERPASASALHTKAHSNDLYHIETFGALEDDSQEPPELGEAKQDQEEDSLIVEENAPKAAAKKRSLVG